MKPVLRVIFGGQRVFQLGPDRVWLVKIITGQYNCTLGQAGDGLHQQQCRAARSGRAGQNNRVLGRGVLPAVDQIQYRLTLARFFVDCAVMQADQIIGNANKRLGAGPMARQIRDIQCADGIGCDTFAVHFINQRRQAVGQVIKRGARRQIRLCLEQFGHQLRQLQPQPQWWNRRRQPS